MAADVATLKRLQKKNVVVGAVKDGDPGNLGCWPRKEIDEFIQDKDTCNLFLLALSELQKGEDPWSWFGVSSLHGLPPGGWQGIGLQDAINSRQVNPATDFWTANPAARQADPNAGYCSHASVLFPTWHRPFLAMMEQMIYLKVLEIADKYSGKDPLYPTDKNGRRRRYQEAAKRFRLPYLDPLLARQLLEPVGAELTQWRCGVPKILSIRRVVVYTPTDPRYPKEIPNPLYSYEFAKKWNGQPKYNFDDQGPFKWSELWSISAVANNLPVGFSKTNTPNHRTFRRPSAIDGASCHTFMNIAWMQQMLPTGIKQYELLSDIANVNATYASFSCKRYFEDARDLATRNPSVLQSTLAGRSVESIHDAGHSWAGTPEFPPAAGGPRAGINGHMQQPPYSSYDPFFWLHHCNIDRLTAIWQTLNPLKWGFSQNNKYPTFTEPEGYTQTPESPLMPFLRVADPKSFWTSNGCQDWRVFGYDYEECRRDIPNLTLFVNNRYQWLMPPHAATWRPPARHITGFPRDLSPAHCQCIPAGAFIDGGTAVWTPDFRDVPPPLAPPPPPRTLVRSVVAKSTITPEVLGVDTAAPVVSVSAEAIDDNAPVSLPPLMSTDPVRQWDVMVQYEKFGLDGCFYVFFFFGDVKASGNWTHQSNYVGEIFNWASGLDAPCPNCISQGSAGLVVGDLLPLTPKLTDFLSKPTLLHPISLASLSREDVVPFLKKYLQWRVVDTAGKVYPPAEVPQFKVLVADRIYNPPKAANEFGTYDEYEVWAEATAGKAGGWTVGDEIEATS